MGLRNLEGTRCASAIYNRPGESYILLGNLESKPQEVRCVALPNKLPYPSASPAAATVLVERLAPRRRAEQAGRRNLNVGRMVAKASMGQSPPTVRCCFIS